MLFISCLTEEFESKKVVFLDQKYLNWVFRSRYSIYNIKKPCDVLKYTVSRLSKYENKIKMSRSVQNLIAILSKIDTSISK